MARGKRANLVEKENVWGREPGGRWLEDSCGLCRRLGQFLVARASR